MESDCVAGINPVPRIPPFWKQNPELWLLQAESVFKASRITSQVSQFHILVSALDMDILLRVSDILKNPGPDPLNALKARLLKVYSPTAISSLNRLLEERHLGDEEPSHTLARMRQMASGHDNLISPDLLETLWVRALPPRHQEIIAGSGCKTLEEKAHLADTLFHIPSPSVSAIRDQPQDHYAEITTQLRSLTRDVETLRKLITPSIKKTTAGGRRMCFYHEKFGQQARKCQSPCSYEGNLKERQ